MFHEEAKWIPTGGKRATVGLAQALRVIEDDLSPESSEVVLGMDCQNGKWLCFSKWAFGLQRRVGFCCAVLRAFFGASEAHQRSRGTKRNGGFVLRDLWWEEGAKKAGGFVLTKKGLRQEMAGLGRFRQV
jgi:hypothetical protein